MRVGGRPVVGMRVREQHPLHAVAHRGADDRLDVLRDVGTGIDHRDLVDPDEIGVRSRARHQARVVRDDAPDQRRERARNLGCHRRPRLLARLAARDRALGAERDVGQRDRPLPGRSTGVAAAARRARRFRRRRHERASVRVARDRVEVARGDPPCVRSAPARAGSSRSGRSGRSRRRRAARARRPDEPTSEATSSLSSCAPSSPSGASATKNHVLYRRGAPSGVSQCENTRRSRAASTRSRVSSRSANVSAPAFRSAAGRVELRVVLDDPARSTRRARAGCPPLRSTRATRRCGSRARRRRGPARRWPPGRRGRRPARCDLGSRSSGSTAPPGNTVAPGPNTARRVRSSIRTCRSGRSDTRITVAASRVAGMPGEPATRPGPDRDQPETRTGRSPKRRRLSSIQSTWPLPSARRGA